MDGAKLSNEIIKMKTEIMVLNQNLEQAEDLLKKKSDEVQKLQDDVEKNSKNDEVLRLVDVVSSMGKEVDELKKDLNEKDDALAKMSDKVHDLTSNCALWEDEVNDLKSHCAQLNQTAQEKEVSHLKLKEECIKKEAVIEYLTNEKAQLLNTQSTMHETLHEMSARLKEAADLYKKQYVKIHSLKKMIKSESTVKIPDFHESPETSRERIAHASAKCPKLLGASSNESSVIPSSDSDTGEHLRKACNQYEKLEERYQKAQYPGDVTASYSTTQAIADTVQRLKVSPSAPVEELIEKNAAAKSEALHQMIEENLAHLSASGPVPKPFRDEVYVKEYSLPCPLCETTISVLSDNTDAMVEHLEKTHRQKMCPICGRLFDMKLPPKYFIFHVDEHYNFVNRNTQA